MIPSKTKLQGQGQRYFDELVQLVVAVQEASAPIRDISS